MDLGGAVRGDVGLCVGPFVVYVTLELVVSSLELFEDEKYSLVALLNQICRENDIKTPTICTIICHPPSTPRKNNVPGDR